MIADVEELLHSTIIERGGVQFSLGTAQAVQAIGAEICAHRRYGCEGDDVDGLPRPPCRRLEKIVGCERCGIVCVLGIADCRCCKSYGVNSGGGTLYYNDDGKHHVPVCSADEYLAMTPAGARI